MENRPLLEGPAPDPHGRKNGENHLLARPQYIEVPSSAVVEEPGPGLLLEYWDILRRHKGTLILIAFLCLLTSILLTLPQAPVYQYIGLLFYICFDSSYCSFKPVDATAALWKDFPEPVKSEAGTFWPPRFLLSATANHDPCPWLVAVSI